MTASYYSKNKERMLAQQKLRRESRKEAEREYQRNYYLKHKEKYKTPEYKARAKAAKKVKYDATPPEVRAARSREYYLRNKEASIARARAWAERNEARKVTNLKVWKEANREMVRLCMRKAVHKRRASLKASSSIGVSVEEWAEILAAHGYVCAYCRGNNKGNRLERDHVTPIALGGLDEPANVVPACRSCNASKGPKTLEQWAQHKGSAQRWVSRK